MHQGLLLLQPLVLHFQDRRSGQSIDGKMKFPGPNSERFCGERERPERVGFRECVKKKVRERKKKSIKEKKNENENGRHEN